MNFNEWRTQTTSRELWTDFENWLFKTYKLTLKDLSWNEYIAYSRTYSEIESPIPANIHGEKHVSE